MPTAKDFLAVGNYKQSTEVEEMQQKTSQQSEDPDLYISFSEFNKRRHMRGAAAARFEIYYTDGEMDLLWMTPADIRKNMKAFPHCIGDLTRGLACYGIVQ